MINVNSRYCPFLEINEKSVLRAYLDFGLEEGFYSVWNGVFLTFVVMMTTQLIIEQLSPFRRLTGITNGGDLIVHLSPQSAGGMVQCVAGRLRR